MKIPPRCTWAGCAMIIPQAVVTDGGHRPMPGTSTYLRKMHQRYSSDDPDAWQMLLAGTLHTLSQAETDARPSVDETIAD